MIIVHFTQYQLIEIQTKDMSTIHGMLEKERLQ